MWLFSPCQSLWHCLNNKPRSGHFCISANQTLFLSNCCFKPPSLCLQYFCYGRPGSHITESERSCALCVSISCVYRFDLCDVVATPLPLVNHQCPRCRHLAFLTSYPSCPLSLVSSPCLSRCNPPLPCLKLQLTSPALPQLWADATKACHLNTGRPMLCALSSTISPMDS